MYLKDREVNKWIYLFLCGEIPATIFKSLQGTSDDPILNGLLKAIQDLIYLQKEISATNIFLHTKDNKITVKYMDFADGISRKEMMEIKRGHNVPSCIPES